MSRGLGRTQRLALGSLVWWAESPYPFYREHWDMWWSLGAVAQGVASYEEAGTFSPEDLHCADYVRVESVRRAIRTLALRGLVELDQHPVRGTRCRLPLDSGKRRAITNAYRVEEWPAS